MWGWGGGGCGLEEAFVVNEEVRHGLPERMTVELRP